MMSIINAAPIALQARRWGKDPPRSLWMHGFGEGSFVWDHVIPSVLTYGSAVAVDLRGHGESGHVPAHEYSIENHVADVSAALQRHFAHPLFIVGHSLGAIIAMHLARIHSRQILGVVLVDGGPELNPEAMSHLCEEFAKQAWHYRSLEAYARNLESRFPLAQPALLRSIAPLALRDDSMGGFRLRCDRAMTLSDDREDDESTWSLFRSIECPVLVMRGAGSAMLMRSTVEKMVRELAQCSLETIPFAGHAVMLDNPSGFTAALQRFIAKLR